MPLNVSTVGTDLKIVYTISTAGVPENAETVVLTIVRPDGGTDGPYAMDNTEIGSYLYIYSPPVLAVANNNRFEARVVTTNPNTSSRQKFVVRQ